MSLLNRSYWKRVIAEIEWAAHQKRVKDRIENYDFSVTLPENLRKRVAKIMPYEYDEYDRLVYIDEYTVEAPLSVDETDQTDEDGEKVKKEKKKHQVFNESTCSEIERLENEYIAFEVKVEAPVKRKLKEKKQINWCSEFICKSRRERVKWDSKIYQLEHNISEMTLDEQAEQLMDASAERFTEWLNAMGSQNESNLTKSQLIALFSIEGDRRLLASIQTEPKEVKAIAKAVADKWNLPEMAIELKFENYIKSLLAYVPKRIIKVAFGRTVPYKDRPWVPTAHDQPITTVFPDELLSGQKLFKGIGYLRSTKAMMEFYRTHPKLETPNYFIKSGLFNRKEKTTATTDVPLYELLKLKY